MKNYGKIYKYHVYYILDEHNEGWIYKIYSQSDNALVCEAAEWFECPAQAGFAAIGHISLLENAES